ncbi:hypothetical protein J6590_018286 [Homalodisca vitripennis]|nr:hypothetical protein J6590_018286 [Homalodisca vitripennis]
MRVVSWQQQRTLSPRDASSDSDGRNVLSSRHISDSTGHRPPVSAVICPRPRNRRYRRTSGGPLKVTECAWNYPVRDWSLQMRSRADVYLPPEGQVIHNHATGPANPLVEGNGTGPPRVTHQPHHSAVLVLMSHNTYVAEIPLLSGLAWRHRLRCLDHPSTTEGRRKSVTMKCLVRSSGSVIVVCFKGTSNDSDTVRNVFKNLRARSPRLERSVLSVTKVHGQGHS